MFSYCRLCSLSIERVLLLYNVFADRLFDFSSVRGGAYIYIHMHVHTYIRTNVHTYIRTYVQTYIRTYVHTYTYIHTVLLLQGEGGKTREKFVAAVLQATVTHTNSEKSSSKHTCYIQGTIERNFSEFVLQATVTHTHSESQLPSTLVTVRVL